MAGTAHPTRRPGNFETQLRKQQNERKFEEAKKQKEAEQAKLKKQLQDARDKVDKTKASKIAAEKTLAEQRIYLKYLEDQSLLPGSPGGSSITSGELAEIVNQKAIIAETKIQVQTFTTIYAEATAKLQALTKQATPGPNDATKKKVKDALTSNFIGKGAIDNGGVTPPGDQPGIVYKYNAPMVRTAYLNPFGVQGQTSNRSINDPGNYQDAKNAWSNNLGAKGTIQMSRQYASNNPVTNTVNKSYDDNLYGFKFLYNPKEVSMAWGTSTEVNWDYVSLGLDKASAVSLGILKSTITFSLLLNRTGDMAYLDKNGTLTHMDGSNDIVTLHQPKDIYPYDVSEEDLQMIYKKGTMYDLEYLFRTVMGLNSNYESTLNGKTADRGWLNAAPVELHLGDGMRYLIRLSTLDVNHIMFNDRMVPILSSVNVTCHRFYDGTDASLDNSKSSSGGIG